MFFFCNFYHLSQFRFDGLKIGVTITKIGLIRQVCDGVMNLGASQQYIQMAST
jgi:hypothetical protein